MPEELTPDDLEWLRLQGLKKEAVALGFTNNPKTLEQLVISADWIDKTFGFADYPSMFAMILTNELIRDVSRRIIALEEAVCGE